jgi:hypothetical protein
MSKNTQNTRTFLKEKIIQKCSKIFLIKFVSTILLFITDYELATHPATGKIVERGGKSMPR